jgi:predicted RNase H-like HicB family nuclease
MSGSGVRQRRFGFVLFVVTGYSFVMSNKMIIVRAMWDNTASVWVATSEDVPGLVAEANTLEALNAKLPVMIADLIELNGTDIASAEIPLHIIAEHTGRVTNPRAA